MTEEEVILWQELRAFRKAGWAFRRQAPVGRYVVDFLCRKAMLIVEVDGSHHDRPERMEHDQRRDRWLKNNGYSVLRIDAKHIWQDIDSVVVAIEHQLTSLA